MAIPSSGAISLATIQTEYGGANPISLSEYYRGGTYVPNTATTTTIPTSGTISVSNFYGTSNTQYFTISANQTNLDLRTYVNGLGYNGLADVVVTINAGVTVYATTTGFYALTVTNFPRAVTITNNGSIMGAGGAGGSNAVGNGGQIALRVTQNVTIYNNGYVAGGGGGGGGAFYTYSNSRGYVAWTGGGGGAGGGAGGLGGNNGTTAGGAGGGLGAAGGNGTAFNSAGTNNFGFGGGSAGGGGCGTDNGRSTGPGGGSGGGGGRILPGTGGAGGTSRYSAFGGGGGSANGGGGNGASGALTAGAGGGGGWGAAGGTGYTRNESAVTARGGGAGGYASYTTTGTITWAATGTRYGTVA